MRANDPRFVAAFDGDRERLRVLAEGESWAARALAVVLAANAAARGEDSQQVRALVEHGLRDGRLLAERGAGGWASAHALFPLVLIEADARALDVVEELAAQARRCGAPFGGLTAIAARGWVHARRGELAAAEADLRTAWEVSVQDTMPLLITTGLMWLVDATLERPSLDDVAALMESLELEPVFLAHQRGCDAARVPGAAAPGAR